MARKKDSDKEEIKSLDDKIRVISNRPGDICCPCGAVLRKGELTWITKESLDLLKECFAEFLIIIE